MSEIKKKVVILSDATGDTADKVVRAALSQFEDHGARVELFTRVRDEKEIEEIVDRAAEENALLVHTVVNPAHREHLQHLCDEAQIDQVDLIGPLIGKLTGYLGRASRAEPGGLHKVNEEYFARIEAVEFAVKNDDGQHPRNLHRADVVLVGISRTSKTPLSTYLAQRGHKVANVPIVMGIEPPPELFAVDQRRVYALDIRPEALFRIRQARLQQLGMPSDTAYGMRDHIEKEIGYARQLFEANPHWPVLDVTDRAIEETAAVLLQLKKQRELGEARRLSRG